MDIYVTSKNNGPSLLSDCVYMKYIGSSLEDAIKAVGDFKRYEMVSFPFDGLNTKHSSLPRDVEREMVKYYMADGWWYSIEKVTFDE